MLFADLADRISEIRDRLARAVQRGGHGQEVKIVAVTKTFGPEAVTAAFGAGLTEIGENKVQEALAKQSVATVPVRWHLIGHLQRNKVKSLEHFQLFHALDSGRLADAIDAWARPRNTPVRVLAQVNVMGEETKGGHPLEGVEREAERLRGLAGLSVVGAMTMAPFDADESTLRRCFSGARKARELLAAAGHPASELSMGMSGDYEIAVEEGATLVRLGTILFGARS
jgi:pyridoxal phosphate enzyme (YggS family)